MKKVVRIFFGICACFIASQFLIFPIYWQIVGWEGAFSESRYSSLQNTALVVSIVSLIIGMLLFFWNKIVIFGDKIDIYFEKRRRKRRRKREEKLIPR